MCGVQVAVEKKTSLCFSLYQTSEYQSASETMEIPLKSRPKVSMVGLHDESSFEATPLKMGDSSSTIIGTDDGCSRLLRNPKTRTSARNSSMSQPIAILPELTVLDTGLAGNDELGPFVNPKSFRLTRTYSESEKNNFHLVTGHRMFDDGKIRPTSSRNNSFLHLEDDDDSPTSSVASNRLYSRSHNEYTTTVDHGQPLQGLEDEYIPGLDFSTLVYEWSRNSSEQNMNRGGILYDDRSLSSSSSTNPSREVSYLDLNKLHAKVSPQPILRDQKDSLNKYAFGKLDPHKLRRSKTTLAEYRNDTRGLFGDLASESRDSMDHKVKRQKSAVDPVTGEVNYEVIINSLPQNFNDLPYSQRKKLVKSFSDSIDYSQFSMFAKSFLSKGGSGSNNSSFVARSRRGSTNTIAGRLLAISSTTDLKTMPEEPKFNVDEKGAIVMGHVLGKVIGFGAWGTIRQCTSPEGKILAIKIVKSTKESSDPNKTSTNSKSPKENSKVLTFFKKEIEIWKKLHHKHILPLLKYLETEHAIFCITERINGGTLFELVTAWGPLSGGIIQTQGPISYLATKHLDRIHKVVEYMKQIVDAVMYMHGEMGIVHGDLKLENVLVDDTAEDNQMVLCDFGMARVYDARVSMSRRSSLKVPDMARSQSSSTAIRKPYHGNSDSVRHLFKDDSKIGISNLLKVHGPSLQSVDLTPTQSLSHFHDYNRHGFDSSESDIDSDLPHTHIGSLPYASPELLLPSPPPLGPSADIWALGVLLFSMLVGKLPFQHQYEPRLRAMIANGKFNTTLLRRACMMEWFIETPEESDESTGDKFSSASFGDPEREAVIENLRKEWLTHDAEQYSWLFDLVCGCLEKDITKRLDIYLVNETLCGLGSK